MTNSPLCLHKEFLLEHTNLLLTSYKHWLKRDLIVQTGDPERDAELLFLAPCVVVSGGSEADQLLNYGNQAALDLWEIPFETFCGTPSRLTAEPMHRSARAEFLKRVRNFGFVENYQGVRISSSGQRFKIKKATVWNLLTAGGSYAGQAAAFSAWSFCE
ncbi:MAG: MEKHLA domain-containing protein [Blastochloris sp.]|nr:MEKHLA domain-containing protein [Blastochloris sp.]